MRPWKESAEVDRTRQNGRADRAAIARWESEGGRVLDDDALATDDGGVEDERSPSRPGPSTGAMPGWRKDIAQPAMPVG